MNSEDLKLEIVSYQNNTENPEKTTFNNKFVFIKNRNVVTLVMGPIPVYPYHAQLVERFCNDNNISAIWVRKPDLFEISDLEILIKGGGLLDIYQDKKVIKVHGYSTAYGPFSTEYIKKFVADHPFFAGLSVRVRAL